MAVIKLAPGQGWSVGALVDDDGHLNLFITNNDGTTIHEVETGQGDGVDGEALAFRLTTSKIEQDHHEKGEE